MSLANEFTLLFVDDDPLLHKSLKMIVPKHWRVVSFLDPGLAPFDKFFHLAFIDMHLLKDSKDPIGLKVIKKLYEFQPQLEIVAVSGDWNRELMEQTLNMGAQKFLTKPWQEAEVLQILEKTEALWNIRNASYTTQKTKWIGSSSISQSLKNTMAGLKGEMSPVLIEGETGTGKEVVARILHEQEADRPFIAVNIAAIPENLFESEMFGHIRGAFTGADQNKVGLIEAAHGGDLFLDEVEEFPLQHQAKLLRFLEAGEVRRVGSKENLKVQTRVIVASNKSLESLVKEGKFREDLYFRLASQKIQLPPLRSRPEDIPELAAFFLEKHKPRRNKVVSDDGLQALRNYDWPGNVRELRRVCEQLALTAPLPIIRAEDVKQWIRSGAKVAASGNLDYSIGLAKLLENFEAQVIEDCLRQEPDVEKAAGLLQISKSNLYKKMKDYGIRTRGEN